METTQALNEVETSADLQKRLEAANDSLYSFANRNDFNYRTVCTVAQRWWHRRDRTPHGGLAQGLRTKIAEHNIFHIIVTPTCFFPFCFDAISFA